MTLRFRAPLAALSLLSFACGATGPASPDAGGTDGSSAHDAGSPDAGGPDAAPPDSGPAPDAGPGPDGGPGPDAGPTPDAGPGPDGGSASDGGSTLGPNGGTVSNLYFAVVGDTRPNLPGLANYPTAIITKIYDDMEALSPRPDFVAVTGDYMLSVALLSDAQKELALYTGAMAHYTGVIFPGMGNHECDLPTTSNCAGNTTNANFIAYKAALVTPYARTEPYYSVRIDDTNGAWTSKLVVLACNDWDATQSSWFSAEMAKPTTYTLVVRHEPSTATSAPCVPATNAVLATASYDLLLEGHVHDFQHSGKELIVGTGGAQISSGQPYGYATVERIAGGWQVKQYDYSTNLPVSTFVVP